MEWFEALILGIVQGASEYLPISSSGHLEIFRRFLGVELPADEALQFDLIVHAATVCSTLVILWPMFRKLCKGFFGPGMFDPKNSDATYVWKVLLSCIPVGIVGVFFKDYVEAIFGSGLLVVGICLLVTAALLSFAYFTSVEGPAHKPVSAEKGREINWKDALIIGCAQAVAVLPGLSRSGSTIATGILLGDKRDRVASFSFIMVILPILGEALLDLAKMLKPGTEQAFGTVSGLSMCIGFLAAFLVGCAACKWMIDLVKKGKLVWFAIYCVVMGLVCIIFH